MQTMRTPGVALLLSEEVVPAATTVVKDMQILKTGRFYDPRYKWFDVTEKMLGEMVSNFKSGIRGIVPGLDYSHDSDGVAAGWIKDLFIKEGSKAGEKQLWGKVELTPRCQKTLADKEFGYISSDFDDNYIDNETGKKHGTVLKGAALTNRPVIKGMDAVIQLSEQADQQNGLDSATKGEQMEKQELEKKLSETEAKVATMETKAADAEKKLGDVDAVLKAAGIADLEALMKWIGEQKAKTSAAPAAIEVEKELTETKKELSEVKTKLTEATKKAADAEKETEFNKLLSEGKAVAAQKEAFLAGDMNKFISLAQPMKTEEAGHGAGGKGAEGADDEILKAAKTLSESAKIPMQAAISRVLSENKELKEKRDKTLN